MGQYATTNSLDNNRDTTCRDLCEGMITTLPRELRDIIYEYILCDTLYKDVAVSTNEPASSQAGLDYWQVEKVADTAWKELFEAWYRSVRIHMGEDLGYIERFLSLNVARLGIPRHHLITKISITFNQRDVVFLEKPLGGDVTRVPTSRARILERLEHLFLLKRGASIHLYVIIGCRWTRRMMMIDARSPRRERKVLRQVTTVMSDVLSRLSAEGYRLAMAIQLFSRRPDKSSLFDLCSGNLPLEEED
jgi:hypothetical protein